MRVGPDKSYVTCRAKEDRGKIARAALAAPAPAEPERAKHIPGTVPIYRNGRVEYVPPIEAPHVCGMSGFNPKGDTCERCDAERFAREAPAASSAAEGSVATGEGGE
jgi:hypothetical protein